jgi:O-antigen/teichoic acid export membrane protein
VTQSTMAASAADAAATSSAASRVRAALRNPLYLNVYALSLNTVLSSALGIGYWVVAARLYSPRDLGAGAAVISTMTFLSSLAQLNLNGAIARFLPAAGRHARRLIGSAYGASCAAALVAGSVFLIIAPIVSPRTGPLVGGPWLAATFVVAVAAWTMFTLQDSVLTAVRGAVWVPVENAAFGIVKIALLILLASAAPALGVYASWTIAVVLALVPVNVLVFRRLLPRLNKRHAAALPARAVLLRFASLDYVGYLFMQCGTNALPVLVAAVLGARANAVFYIGWLLGTAAELVVYHFGTSLTVESARDETQLATYTRQVLVRGLLLFTPGALMLCLGAPFLLPLFGGEYAAGSETVLRLFALAVVPKFVVTVFIAANRVRRRVGRIVLIQFITSAIVVCGALLTMPAWSVAGVGAAYLTAQVVMAGAVLPPLVRLLRGIR